MVGQYNHITWMWDQITGWLFNKLSLIYVIQMSLTIIAHLTESNIKKACIQNWLYKTYIRKKYLRFASI